MNNWKSNEERRQDQRFEVAGNAFATMSAFNGLITNISMNGLAFRYVDRKTRTADSPYLDIVIDEHDFNLNKIPYRLVSDNDAQHDCPDPSLIVKQRCVQFDNLSGTQKAELEYFIKNYAADCV